MERRAGSHTGDFLIPCGRNVIGDNPDHNNHIYTQIGVAKYLMADGSIDKRPYIELSCDNDTNGVCRLTQNDAFMLVQLLDAWLVNTYFKDCIEQDDRGGYHMRWDDEVACTKIATMKEDFEDGLKLYMNVEPDDKNVLCFNNIVLKDGEGHSLSIDRCDVFYMRTLIKVIYSFVFNSPLYYTMC